MFTALLSACWRDMAAITWDEDFDDNDNSIWVGASPYTTDSDPEAVPDVYWRLKQRLVSNRIEWYADNDAELGGKTGETWQTIEEAKSACQSAHNHILVTEG